MKWKAILNNDENITLIQMYVKSSKTHLKHCSKNFPTIFHPHWDDTNFPGNNSNSPIVRIPSDRRLDCLQLQRRSGARSYGIYLRISVFQRLLYEFFIFSCQMIIFHWLWNDKIFKNHVRKYSLAIVWCQLNSCTNPSILFDEPRRKSFSWPCMYEFFSTWYSYCL